MSEMQPIDRDLDHLRLLAIFHYVWAALVALTCLFYVVSMFIGGALIVGGAASKEGGDAAVVGGFLIAVYGLVLVLSIAYGICVFLAGRNLQRQRSRIFCMVIAALTCLSIPLGTVLGVFTLVVLSRDSVRARFS